jgi:hypothetical protein
LSSPFKFKQISSPISKSPSISTVPCNAIGIVFFLPFPNNTPGFVDTIHVFFHGLYALVNLPFLSCTGVPDL